MECEAGKQQPLPGKAFCENCPYGRYKAEPGTHACGVCSAGKYTSESTTLFACGECSFGQYQNISGGTSCRLCELGKYQDSIGQSVCSNCVNGTVAAEGQFTCFACGAGTWSSLDGGECVACEAGKYAPSGSSNCLDCAAGTYSFADSSSCLQCAAGTYQPDTGSTTCEDCVPGTYISEEGWASSAGCLPCETGHVSAQFGSTECQLCSSSVDFQNKQGQAYCHKCPAAAVAIVDRSNCECSTRYYAIPFHDDETFREIDPDGFEIYEGVAQDFNPNAELGFFCALCPNGADCFEQGTTIANVTAMENYFLGIDSTGTTFFPCFNTACMEGGGCDEGYTGPSCTNCEEGLILTDTYECAQCPSTFVTVAMLLGGLLLLLTYLYFIVKQKRSGAKPKTTSVFLKIVMSTLQVNSIALSYSFDWDAVMDTFLSSQGQLTSMGISSIQLGCLSKSQQKSFVAETVTYGLVPVVLIGGALALVLFKAMCCSTGADADVDSDIQNLHPPHSELFPVEITKREGLDAKRVRPTTSQDLREKRALWKHAKDDATGVAVIVLFLLQPYLVKRCALIVACTQLGKDPSDVYLLEDLSIQCYSSIHFIYMTALGLPLFVFYVAGVPLAVYYILNRQTNLQKVYQIMDWLQASENADGATGSEINTEAPVIRQLDERSRAFLNNFSFLFLGYTKEQHSWEVTHQ